MAKNKKKKSARQAVKKEKQAKKEGRKVILQYVLGFVALIVLFYALYSSTFFEERIVNPSSVFQTKIASALLNLFSYDTSVVDGMLQSESASLEVAKGCDGMEPLALFIVGLLLVPFSMRLKWTLQHFVFRTLIFAPNLKQQCSNQLTVYSKGSLLVINELHFTKGIN